MRARVHNRNTLGALVWRYAIPVYSVYSEITVGVKVRSDRNEIRHTLDLWKTLARKNLILGKTALERDINVYTCSIYSVGSDACSFRKTKNNKTKTPAKICSFPKRRWSGQRSWTYLNASVFETVVFLLAIRKITLSVINKRSGNPTDDTSGMLFGPEPASSINRQNPTFSIASRSRRNFTRIPHEVCFTISAA